MDNQKNIPPVTNFQFHMNTGFNLLRHTPPQPQKAEGNFNLAQKLLLIHKKLDTKHNRKEIKLGLARAKQLDNKLDMAISIFETIEDWENDFDAILGIAYCYQEKKEYGLACEYFLKIIYQNPKKVALALGRCEQEMGHYDGALITFKSFVNWGEYKDYVMAIGRCEQEKRNYTTALLHYYDAKKWEKNGDVSLAIGICQQEMGLYQAALITYQNNKQRAHQRSMIIAMAECQTKLKKYDEALKTYQSVKGWQKNKTVLLAIFGLTKETNNLEYLFKSDPTIYYTLIQYYLSINNIRRAKELFNLFKKYTSQPKLETEKIQLLFSNQELVMLTKSIISDSPYQKYAMNMHSLNLPLMISNIFNQEFLSQSNQAYLVGPTLSKMISNEEIEEGDKNVPLAFVFSQPGAFQQILKLGFSSTHTKNIIGFDLTIADMTNQKDPYRFYFTIDAVFCSRQGDIYDPTLLGVSDTKRKILRTVLPAEAVFKENAEAVLKAIDALAHGYTPTHEVNVALKTWIGPSFEQEHFFMLELNKMIEGGGKLQKYKAILLYYNINYEATIKYAMEQNQSVRNVDWGYEGGTPTPNSVTTQMCYLSILVPVSQPLIFSKGLDQTKFFNQGIPCTEGLGLVRSKNSL